MSDNFVDYYSQVRGTSFRQGGKKWFPNPVTPQMYFLFDEAAAAVAAAAAL